MKKLIPFFGLILLLGCHKMAKVDQFNLTLGEKGIATSSSTSGEAPAPAVENDRLPDAPLAGRVPAGVPAPVAETPKEKDPLEEAVAALKDGVQGLLNRGNNNVEEGRPFSPEIGGGDLSPLVPFIENYADLDGVTRPAANANVEREAPVYVTRIELTLTLGEGTNAVGPVFFDYMESPTEMEPVDTRLPEEQSFELDPSLAHLDDPIFSEGRYHFSLNLPEADRLDSMEYFRVRNVTSAADDGLDRFLLQGIELRLFNGEALVEQVVIESGNLKVNVSRNLLLAFARTESLRTKLLRHPASRADQFVLVFSTGESGFEGDFNLSIGGENGSPATQWMNVRNPFGFRRNTTSVLYLCGRDDPQAGCYFPENRLRSFAYPSEVGPIEAVFDRSATDWDLRSFSVTARFHNGGYTTICHKESPKFVWGGFVLSCRPSYIIDVYQP